MVDLTYEHLPNVVKVTLPNQMRVIIIEMPHIHSCDISMYIKTGSRHESSIHNGISHFLEHMMFRGTRKYPNSYKLSEAFEFMGGELMASTGGEHTYYGFTPHPSRLEEGIKLFYEFFNKPLFDSIETEKQVVLEELLQEQNEQGIVIDKDSIACSMLWPDSSLKLSTLGNKKNVLSFTKEDLIKRYTRYYTPESMVLCIAGRINSYDVLKFLNKTFAFYGNDRIRSYPHKFKPVPEFLGQKTLPQTAFVFNDSSQCEVQICVRSLAVTHHKMPYIKILQRILDDGTSSRLQRNVREKQGLVYDISCSINGFSDCGTIDIDVSVSKNKLIKTIKSILKELKVLTKTSIAPRELLKVKSRYIMELEMELDSPSSMSYRYGWYELFSSAKDTIEEISITQKITAEELLQTAQELFCYENIYLVCVGNVSPDSKEKDDIEKIIREF